MKIGIILGSTRPQRFGDKVANWLLAELKLIPNITTELLDLREIHLPFFDEAQPASDLNGVYSHPEANRWAAAIKTCDQLIFVTPEYNHSYPAVLKNAVDYLYSEWHGKPYAIVSYSSGGIAGARAAMQLRALLDYMGLHCKGELNIAHAPTVITETGVVESSWSERAQLLFKKLLA